MTSLPVSVLGIGIARHQSIGYWVLGSKLGIVLTLLISLETTVVVGGILLSCVFQVCMTVMHTCITLMQFVSQQISLKSVAIVYSLLYMRIAYF